MENVKDEALWKAISIVLDVLEKDEEIVICSSSNIGAIKEIYEAVVSVVPKSDLTDLELYGVRSLILEAIEDKNFFDSEMPTLTGYTAEQFRKISKKLPRE